MKYAWIEDNRIRDIAAGDPGTLFHPAIASFYATQVPDDAQNGWELIDGEWMPPAVQPSAPADPVAPTPPQVSPIEFKLLFTGQERVAIKEARATDAMVDDFYSIVEDPRLTFVDLGLQSTQGALAYLASKSLIAESRIAEILTGVIR